MNTQSENIKFFMNFFPLCYVPNSYNVEPSQNGRVVKCAVLWHGRSWVRALAQAIGSSRGSDLDVTNACGYI